MNGTVQKPPANDAETRAHQEETARIRFKQSLIQGFSGPVIFGLVAAGGSALMTAAGASLLASFAIGILAIAAVTGLYFTSKLGAQLTYLDQGHQAKLIAKGINGPVIEPKPISLPSQDQDKATAALDTAPIQDKESVPAPHIAATSAQLKDKVVPITALDQARTA